MKKYFLLLIISLFSSISFSKQIIYVSGRGSDNSFCAANTGSFCLDNSKRRAESTAEREAQWNCELSNRGRALTYTSYRTSYCNPSFLPFDHEATWVYCNSDVQMQCEID